MISLTKPGTKSIAFLFGIMTMLGCSDEEIIYPSVPSDTDPDQIVLETGEFETNSSKYKASYGTLLVPENRNKAGSRLIELPVIRIYSSGNGHAEPIFYLAGGPGSSNMDFMPADYMLSNHDFVMVGYRGVDGSSVLDCPEVQKAIKGDGDVLNEENLKNLGNAWTNCATRLKEEGVDLDGYTIMEVIEDMEAARIALGYDRINLLSGSYGTRVAYIYALKYHDIINRSVMMAVNPPGRFVWEPAIVDSQLKYYADLWAKDPEMISRTPDLLATMRNVVQNMPQRWFFFQINPGKVKIVTFALLYHCNTAAMAFDAYIAAEKGDPSGLALMSMAYDFIVPSLMTWGENASKAVSADYDSSRDYFTEMDPPNSILGSPMAKQLWGSLDFGSWPIEQIPEEYRKLQHSDVETLLIGGSIDFATPAEFATNELLPYLNKGHQIILSESGHVADYWNLHWEATERLISTFYKTGIVDDSQCNYVPMDFSVKRSFSKIAKLGLLITILGIAIITGGLTLLIRYVLRRIRRS